MTGSLMIESNNLIILYFKKFKIKNKLKNSL